MKDRAFVVPVFHILQKILNGFWRLVGIQFDDDAAQIGFDFDLGIGGNCIECEQRQRKQ